MRSFLTILKIIATFAVVAVLIVLGFGLKKVKEEFGQPVDMVGKEVGNLLNHEQMSDFEPGQPEFNRALELIALGQLDEAREKLLFIQNLFPNSINGPEARRILGEMNMDQLLSVENMDNKKVHVVKRGDAYLNIANRYDTTIDCLMYLNGMLDLGTLHPGDEFVVMGLYFRLRIDVPGKRIMLFRMDEENKQSLFVKEYPIQSMDLPRITQESVQTKVSLKRGEKKGRVYSPATEGYRSASKVLMLERPAVQIRPVPEADDEDAGRGFFLKEEDMEELALLMRLGNEVEIKL